MDFNVPYNTTYTITQECFLFASANSYDYDYNWDSREKTAEYGFNFSAILYDSEGNVLYTWLNGAFMGSAGTEKKLVYAPQGSVIKVAWSGVIYSSTMYSGEVGGQIIYLKSE